MMLALGMAWPCVSYTASVNGVAGVYSVATLPEWRGKGLGAAVSLAPLLEARQRSYRVGVLQSSEMGYKVYQRLGFREVCRMSHYYWQQA